MCTRLERPRPSDRRTKLGELNGTTLIIVQSTKPDELFTAEQCQRLSTLMGRWREARDAGKELPPEEQSELQTLIEAEVRAAGARAAKLVHPLPA
jgi:hypothetical protein